LRQVELDEKRLNSEARLVNATTREKEEQLQEATETAGIASAEFDSEFREMQKISEAAKHAIRLIQLQNSDSPEQRAVAGAQASAALGTFLQVGGGMVTDMEKGAVEKYAQDPEDGTRSKELVDMLGNLRNKLELDMNDASQEHQAMSTKLWTFTDHLNSSIMETHSQMAVIRTQLTQRKREHARLNGRVGDLSSLLSALQAGETISDNACKEEERQRKEVARHIAAESGIVTALLKQMPVGSLSLLFGSDGGAARMTSFLQVDAEASEHTGVTSGRTLSKLRAMAREFPEEAELYADAIKAVESGADGSEEDIDLTITTPKITSAAAFENASASTSAVTNAAGGSDEEDESNSALSNIREFVKSSNGATEEDDAGALAEGNGPSDNSAVAEGLKAGAPSASSLYSGLIGRVRARQRVMASRRNQCHLCCVTPVLTRPP
jgi:hypothetical protein